MNHQWEVLLAKINTEILADKDLLNEVFYQQSIPNSILNEPATKFEIEELEDRLQMKLPVSYKGFLQVSNGLKILSCFNWNLFGTQDVKLLKDFDPAIAKGWSKHDFDASDEEYFVYGNGQTSEFVRGRYFPVSIAISGWGDASMLMLNPEVIHDGEFEAWMFATWIPGATRYKSFWDLVNEEFNNYLEIKAQSSSNI